MMAGDKITLKTLKRSLEDLFFTEFSGSRAKKVVGIITQLHQGVFSDISPQMDDVIEFLRQEAEKIGLQNLVVEKYYCDGKRKWWTWKTPRLWYPRDFELKIIKPREIPLACFLENGSCSTPPGGIIAEIVDVGKGTRETDYASKDVSGRFVLVSEDPKYAGRIAKRKGAIGYITDYILESPPIRTRVDVPDLIGFGYASATIEDDGTSMLAFSISHKQMRMIKQLLEKDIVEVYARVDAVIGEGYLKVLTGTIDGSSKKEEEVLIFSHVNEPGANDNASGSALLLELARTLCSLINKRKISRPKRTLRFMWAPEYFGLIAYTFSHSDWAQKVKAMVCCDMVGENQQLCGGPLILEKTPDFLPSYLNDLAEQYLELVPKEGSKMYNQIGNITLWKYDVATFGGADNAVLTDPSFNVPCIMFSHWPDRFYHTNADTVDKVDPEEMTKVGWVVAMIAMEIANASLCEVEIFASITANRGLQRIGKYAHDSLLELRKIGAAGDHTKLVKHLKETLEVLDHRLRVELKAIESVLSLLEEKEKTLLRPKIEKLQQIVLTRKNQLEDQIKEYVASLVDIEFINLAMKAPPSEIENDAQMIVPIRKWTGWLNVWSSIEDYLGFEKTIALRQLITNKLDPPIIFMCSRTIPMLVDGKKSIMDIVKYLRLQGFPMNDEAIETLIKFFQTLREAGLVDF